MKVLGGADLRDLRRNSGAAFSMFSDLTWIFPIIATWSSAGSRDAPHGASVPWAVALGLVLGGAAGNLVDRIFRAPGPFHGHVVDMFSFFDDNAGHFPVFNIADSALTCRRGPGGPARVHRPAPRRRCASTRDGRRPRTSSDDAEAMYGT